MATLTEEDPSETPVIQPRGRKRLLSGDNNENTGPSPKAIARSEETCSDKSESEEEEKVDHSCKAPDIEDTYEDEPDGKVSADAEGIKDITTPSKLPVLTGRRLFGEDSTDGGEDRQSRLGRRRESDRMPSFLPYEEERKNEQDGRKAKHPKLVRGSESHRYWSFVPLDTTDSDGREQIEVKDEASTK